MKVRAILNPRAGHAAAATREAVEHGRLSWKDYAVYLTREPGHATELAREAVAAEADVVIAVGGDGTVNEVARGVLGSRAALGIVPVGSGNGLARALRLSLRPERALAALEDGVARPIDVGLLNGRLFLNVAGVGFDASVGRAFHERGRRTGRRGFVGYLQLSLRELWRYRAPRLVLEVPGRERLALQPFVLTFANGPQYGSGAVVNPGARLDDGRFEVVAFADASRLATLAATPWLFLGRLDRSPRYTRIPARCATVVSEDPLPIHVDGDPAEPAARIEVELRPRALSILVPAPTLRAGGPFAAEG